MAERTRNEVRVNAKRDKPNSWVPTIINTMRTNDQTIVTAMGSAISIAIFALKVVENRGLGKITEISTSMMRGNFSNTPTIKVTIDKTQEFDKLVDERAKRT